MLLWVFPIVLIAQNEEPIFCADCVAEKILFEIPSLKSIDSVRLEVRNLSSYLEKTEVSRELIINIATKSLTNIGLKISDNSSSILLIEYNALSLESSILVYSVQVSLARPVILDRDKSKRIQAKTWETKTFGYVGRNEVNSIKESISELIEEFIEDYLRGNKKSNDSQSSNPEITKMIRLSKLFMSAEIVHPKLRFSMIRIELFILI